MKDALATRKAICTGWKPITGNEKNSDRLAARSSIMTDMEHH
ncbi:hypothetical protein B488_08890 [Liberibacter crescens BT-1]|uniref:Uncharacterized protein n=1 Tax=Liberibacter crescens (strain BT-1) TaxID=1215343 RepID=L0EWX6_LIBCB|nr:hypothetical protein [Liberibacter crescens]AGA64881.1 hypothetical protein B488_08890 [Liberibacter crescens BT-1]